MHVDVAPYDAGFSMLVRPFDPDSEAPVCGRSYDAAVIDRGSGELRVHVNGRACVVRALLPGTRTPRGGPGGSSARTETNNGPQRVVAPMPGRIAKVLVKVGDTVAPRQGLVVVEAMKMENELRSSRAGTVVEVRAVEGAKVESNALLVVVE
ncbi:MAG: acetyl-CoA carboxylase biotin carboxyl carrier protein subunit [Acidobacteria bacterium]|nr:acetyl-CoA carboxylase biotin carboxyl carrier protein subunit [Acidobacteriota bacterium]